METVYVTEENCALHRCEEHLVLKKKGRSIGTIPLVNLRTIVLFDSVQITSYALDSLFEKNIDLIYMEKSGKIKGRINAQNGGGIILRLAQYAAFLDGRKRLAIASEMVKSKILSQKRLIEKYKRYYSIAEYNSHIAKMDAFANETESAESVNGVMGLEGIGARLYWDCYKRLLKIPGFVKREYRPAPDRINSALNLGYAFLANEITAFLSAAGFDIELGFLHSVHYGRNSLALDVMEEFRSPFVDAWLLGMFNRRILKSEHFKGKQDGYYLTKDGFLKFCDLYHKHVEENEWRAKFKTRVNLLKKEVMRDERYPSLAFE
jgi:CRISPR-associated protein Cas1